MNTVMSNANELTYIYRKHAEDGDDEHLVLSLIAQQLPAQRNALKLAEYTISHNAKF